MQRGQEGAIRAASTASAFNSFATAGAVWSMRGRGSVMAPLKV
jgi:hypothetical protein